jgi:hypothetical protein
MADLQTLLQAVDELNAEEVQQLYAYILRTRGHNVETTQPPVASIPRVIGLHAHLGKAVLSSDFRDPLRDSFWIGE